MNTDKLKSKIIVILGQTSTGKSDFAVHIAKEFKGEIVSADSRQVYKGMNLGSGKITKKEMRGVPHYLLDVVTPHKVFSVSDYKKIADKKIKEILKHKNIPIICGGTGFYIDTLINGVNYPKVPPNKKLREELYQLDAIALTWYLEKLDPKRAKNIDKNNKIRLIRAIEITKALGKVPPLSPRTVLGESGYDVIKIGLALPDEILKEKIKARLLFRIKKGMIQEIKSLHEKGKISWKRLESLGLEYKYGALYLQKIKNLPTPKLQQAKKEMIEKIITETWHYAKRQKTWFKRDKSIIWINPLEIHEQAKAVKKVKEFLK